MSSLTNRCVRLLPSLCRIRGIAEGFAGHVGETDREWPLNRCLPIVEPRCNALRFRSPLRSIMLCSAARGSLAAGTRDLTSKRWLIYRSTT